MTADAVGGVWTYALELARALAGRGVETTLATMGPRPSADQQAEAARIPRLELVSSDFALEWMEHPWRDVAAAGEWLLELDARVRPSLVHLNGYAHGALPWRAPVIVAGHSCVVSWAEATGGALDPAWLARYRRLVTDGLRAADWVIAPSAAMLASLQRHYGPLRFASVVPNGRDAARFPPGAKEPFIFTAGRLWDRAKNVDAVKTVESRLSWPLVMAGSEGLGPLSEAAVAEWLGRASIFVLPARYEPFGLLPLEAALAGCALVLGDIPSLREVWGEAATYVAPDDHAALALAIDRLIEDPVLLGRRAEAARARAGRYTPDAMARGYLRVYDAFIGALRCAS
jgi:glycosyltransferase involved in cell wall biosynthesis